MSSKEYTPEESVPLPPKGAERLTTCCDYCVVACGYNVYRWPVSMPNGGPRASQNAFGEDFPTATMGSWVAPTQHNVVTHNGEPHHVVIIPDKDSRVVNMGGDSSIRGGTIARKCFNTATPTRDRLTRPLMRIDGTLQPVSWDLALDVAAAVGRHVIKKHGANAYSVKQYSYQFVENTYAISKFAKRHVRTAAFTFHDTPADVTSTPGFRDAGFDNFAPSYKDWGDAEVLMICGTDPYETKTVLFTRFIRPAIDKGMKTIWLNPRETAGLAYAKSRGGLHIQLYPGTDNLVLGAISRVILEKGWEDREWIDRWVNNIWESGSGFGQGTRNTPWQWRTTWSKFQTDGVYGEKGYKQWLLSRKEYEPGEAAAVAGIPEEQIHRAAEWLTGGGKGMRPKASFGIEKGFYWSNNTGNTNAICSLATLCGAGGRPGRVVGRFGGHQRGGTSGGKYPRNKSPEKVPGRRRRALDTDRWLVSGHTRLAHVVGTTWIHSMCGSDGLREKFEELVVNNPHQVRSRDKGSIIAALKERVDSGGMVVWDHDIYLRDPIGTRYADIVFPAATWGEEDFVRANGERRIRLYSRFYDPPGQARPDWWIIAQLAKRMGFEGFDWKDSNEVCEESSRFSRSNRKAYHMIKVAAHREGKTLHQKLREMGTEGIQGPTFYNYSTGELHGTVRLHDTTLSEEEMQRKGMYQGANMLDRKITRFNTQTGRINIQKHPWSLFADYWEWMSPRDDELWHTNGRINEAWQSGFDDLERRPYIAQRWPENFVEIHPDDAKARGIESGDWVLLHSDRVPYHVHTIKGVGEDDFQFSELMKNGHIKLGKGTAKAVAIVTPAVKRGVMYSYFLNPSRGQASNSLQGRVVDNVSGNYNYKLGVARVRRIGESRYKGEFVHMSFAPRNIV